MRAIIATGMLGTAACGGSGGSDDSPLIDAVPACTCTGAQGCLTVTVTRSADTSMQPWMMWPSQADGIGMLIVSARDSGPNVVRMTVPNANMTDEYASYPVALGCVPAATLTLGAFLDDNLNAMPGATTSSDYLDSCLLDRQPTRQITAAVNNAYTLALNNSCD